MGLTIALFRRVAVLAMGQRELLLEREDKAVAADDGGVRDAGEEVGGRANNAVAVRLEGRVRLRKEVREVARTRQRVRVAAVRVDDGEEARDQATETDQREERSAGVVAVDRLEAVEQWRGGDADRLGAAIDRRVQDEDPDAGDDQRGQAPDRGPRDVALGVM